MTRTDYALGSEDKVMRDKGYEASARTQVYLSKTKLRLQVGV